MLSIVKFILKVYNTTPLEAAVKRRVVPSTEESANDEALTEYIKNNLSIVHHPLGTAAMLPKEDGGVVDSELKVYGTANVRVVSGFLLANAVCGVMVHSLTGGCVYTAFGE